jgi:hypothetical protein
MVSDLCCVSAQIHPSRCNYITVTSELSHTAHRGAAYRIIAPGLQQMRMFNSKTN